MDPNNITERLANLSPAKRALFEQRLQEKGLGTLAGRTIPLRASRELPPLSFAQQRLWFLSQLEPESCTYNETSALRLDGELNIGTLHSALNAIAERHEVLRTTYAMADDGAPVQIVNYCRSHRLSRPRHQRTHRKPTRRRSPTPRSRTQIAPLRPK
jgi:hypothetical protein